MHDKMVDFPKFGHNCVAITCNCNCSHNCTAQMLVFVDVMIACTWLESKFWIKIYIKNTCFVL